MSTRANTRVEPAPVVVKIGGAGVENPSAAGGLLCALIEVHRSEPGGLVIVHGGGRAVDEHLARLGIQSRRHQGLRVTSTQEIHEIVGVLAGRVNKSIVGAIQALGCPAVGLCLGDGGSVRAIQHRPAGVDIGRVGEIVGGDATLIGLLLRDGFIPVVAPIAFSDAGEPLNVNADDAAAGLAWILGARLLMLLTDVPGVLDESGRLVEDADGARLEAMITSGVIGGGMGPKVRAAIRASAIARTPTVIASWNEPQSIARIVRGESLGTRIVASDTPQRAVTIR